MTVGKPFVASDVNGLHEIVEGQGFSLNMVMNVNLLILFST